MNASEASNFCESNDAHLLSIKNEYENTFITSISKVNSGYYYWLGLLSSPALTGSHKRRWTDGSIMDYEYFGSSQDPLDTSKCATRHITGSVWRFEECGGQRKSYCKRRPNGSLIFIYLFIHSFRSFVHSFIHLLISPLRQDQQSFNCPVLVSTLLLN